jgi:hypothetical protein
MRGGASGYSIAGSAVGSVLFATAALAVGDIPTRYSGAFPSFGSNMSITGTFTGKALTLKYTHSAGGRQLRTSARYACSPTSPTQTACAGTYRTDDGQFGGNASLTVTWSGGRPVALSY